MTLILWKSAPGQKTNKMSTEYQLIYRVLLGYTAQASVIFLTECWKMINTIGIDRMIK
jgi:hypothetical protein